ncbi:MAG: phosphoribosylformylglycinamidine synthase II [Chloroflexi bacterium RBG_16_68_14]|nr:MAG: phosphoribosylformylglycinamidine synthase II [Chloroflexi bacterium RBG_16_68_14]
MTVDQRTLEQIALSWEEYRLACERLDREPSEVELGMIGALWSEHCGYKNSRPLLELFPTSGPRVLTEIGKENAGVIDIGDGLCVALKIESHNHPSAIEPYQGAATGVGGIVRDIFALGARPVAILDSLRFGPLSEARNRYLFNGVVGGIGGYGNCLGVPTVGGEVSFDGPYSGNPLVNAMCVGVARIDRLVWSRAEGPGNPLMLVGADTGRDGIHGATFASVELDERSEERRPAVQIGDPFLEKLLMEACCELAERHGDWIVGMQDLGAAGLTSASVECAAKVGTGVEIDVAQVPRREAGMTPYEVMLSESQERMLVIAKREHEEDVRRHFQHWELHCATVGVVTDDGMATVRDTSTALSAGSSAPLTAGGDRVVARLPVGLLTDPPQYVRESVKPQWLEDLQRYDLSHLPDVGDTNDSLLRLLSSPEVSSKRWVWRQYDHQVLTNTVVGPGSDAAVVRVKGTRKAIALATDGDGRICFLDPYAGGALAVAEAARNVVCVGAEPVAITDCLNFGNPEKPEVYYQLEQCIRGMAAACRALGVPVVSGNVSLYNETSGEPVYPTPVVGMMGLIDDVERAVPMGFQDKGDQVFLLGVESLRGEAADLAGSEYLKVLHHGLVAGRPRIDLELEARVQRLCLEAARRGLLKSAHDCSRGGLAVALAESCIEGGQGLDARDLVIEGRLDAALFGEAPSRIVVSTAEGVALAALAREQGAPLVRLGRVAGQGLVLGKYVDAAIDDLRDAFEAGLPRALGEAQADGGKHA